MSFQNGRRSSLDYSSTPQQALLLVVEALAVDPLTPRPVARVLDAVNARGCGTLTRDQVFRALQNLAIADWAAEIPGHRLAADAAAGAPQRALPAGDRRRAPRLPRRRARRARPERRAGGDAVKRDPEPVADALEAVRDIEMHVATQKLNSEMGPLVAAARIRAWHESLGAIFALAEADIMECCLAIRTHHKTRETFGAFVAEHVRVLTPTRAWQLADTWEVAKKHRPVRELVNREPKKAIAFVREFTAAAAQEQVPLPLDADDREIAGILASPPKKRREQLRDLVAARRAPRDHHPDDLERIRELEAEREERDQAAAAALDSGDPASLRAAVEELAAAEAPFLKALSKVAHASKLGNIPEQTRQRALRICDRVGGALDGAVDAVHWSPPDGEGGAE